jgi:hypothetical protein
LTIIVDDAGMGDLLYGVVIAAYRSETREFRYEVIDVKYFRHPTFKTKQYLKEASTIVSHLLDKLKLQPDEPINICQGYIFDEAVKNLQKAYGETRIKRGQVLGEPQRLTETAYLDELRNLGYQPVQERDSKRAKSFFHMMNWLQKHPDKLIYAKTGWPRLNKYRLFNPRLHSHRRTERTGRRKTTFSALST